MAMGLGRAFAIRLPEIGAQHIVDHIAEAADDAVVVQAGHIAQRRLDRFAAISAPLASVAVRSGSRRAWNSSTSSGRDIRIARQRLLHIVLAEGDRGLAQEFRHRAQDRDIAPGQARARSPAG